jgi:glycine/D-amino acid oxidase-like deaminating enzyme
MPQLLIVGGGLFGSLAAAWARRQGFEALVFDAGRPGAASPAAAGLFQEKWLRRRWREWYRPALTLLEALYGVQTVALTRETGEKEYFGFVTPNQILELHPVRQQVTAVGDGWLEAGACRYTGWVYVAAGIWCREFFPQLALGARTGAAFWFAGERPGQVRQVAPGQQALAFVRDPGTTYFSDGTAELCYTAEHERQTLARAQQLGLDMPPQRRWLGHRPYTPGGPLFCRLGERLWLGTGGRKLGMLLGALCARRLVEEELLLSRGGKK